MSPGGIWCVISITVASGEMALIAFHLSGKPVFSEICNQSNYRHKCLQIPFRHVSYRKRVYCCDDAFTISLLTFEKARGNHLSFSDKRLIQKKLYPLPPVWILDLSHTGHSC